MRKLFILCLCCLVSSTAIFAQKKKNKQEYNYMNSMRTPEQIRQIDSKLERAYYMQIGYFTNKKQADTTTNPLLKHQEMIVVPLWRRQRTGEYWAYFSWYPGGNVETPLMQFVVKFSKKDRDTLLLETYGVPDEMKGQGWAKEDPYHHFKPNDLRKTGCIHYLTSADGESFELFMPEGSEHCASMMTVKGQAVYYEFNTTIRPESVLTRTTLYDKDGNILISYKPTGNLFERLHEPRYLDILYPKK